MIESRVAPRFRVGKLAYIAHSGQKLSCTVRDMSLTGASLEVFETKSTPEKFTLVIPEDGLEIPCKIVRRTDFRLGVKFD
jgi:hypothetical protein